MIKRVVLALSLLMIGGAVFAQSMGEAARKEKERREKNREKGVKARVYTDADIKTVPGDAAPTSAEGEAGTPREPGVAISGVPDPSPTPSSEDGEATKKARGAQLRSELQSAERALREAERSYAQAQEQYEFIRKAPVGSYSLGDGGRASSKAAFDRAESTMRAAKDYRDGIEDAARREGIPPGWLR